jgi:hypothetical protein
MMRDLRIQRLFAREAEFGVIGRRTNFEFRRIVVRIALPVDVLLGVDTCIPSQTPALADFVVVKTNAWPEGTATELRSPPPRFSRSVILNAGESLSVKCRERNSYG